MGFPLAVFVGSVFTLGGAGILAQSGSVQVGRVLKGVLALAPVAAALVLAGCR